LIKQLSAVCAVRGNYKPHKLVRGV